MLLWHLNLEPPGEPPPPPPPLPPGSGFNTPTGTVDAVLNGVNLKGFVPFLLLPLAGILAAAAQRLRA